MSNVFKEKSGLPIFILFIFAFQFLLFLVLFLNDKESTTLLFFLIGIFIIGILLFFMRLSIIIDENKIQYSFFPFVLKGKNILWSDIKSFNIKKLNIMSDFMGWGLRYSKKYGWCYIVDTNHAIFLKMKNGKKLVISIKNISELETFLKEHNIYYSKESKAE